MIPCHYVMKSLHTSKMNTFFSLSCSHISCLLPFLQNMYDINRETWLENRCGIKDFKRGANRALFWVQIAWINHIIISELFMFLYLFVPNKNCFIFFCQKLSQCYFWRNKYLYYWKCITPGFSVLQTSQNIY